MANNEAEESKHSVSNQAVNAALMENNTTAESRISRRRALIVSLAATPAILSLMNRSAWGGEVSCNLVRSYVNAGMQWTSPRPNNNYKTLAVTDDDIRDCENPT
jgi:hypothetical protein